MLTNKDIEKIITAFKSIIYTKEETNLKFQEQAKSFSKLQSAVDGIAKKTDDNSKELIVINHRTERMEKWVEKAAEIVHILSLIGSEKS